MVDSTRINLFDSVGIHHRLVYDELLELYRSSYSG